MMDSKVYSHFQLFCGLGGLAAGFDDARESAYGLEGSFECIGAVDVCADAVLRFNRYCRSPVAREGDLFSRAQYRAYWDREPGADWHEMTPVDLRNIAGGRSPDVVGTSPPCRGYSGLVSQKKSRSEKYKALNELAFRGVWLALEAWEDDPPALWVLENVPGITSRGSHWIEEIRALMRPYGYSVTGESRCLGELGGLAQRRKRYTLVARHTEKLPALLYQPRSRSLLSVGEVLGQFPSPGDPSAGRLHAPRKTTWRTAARLSLIKPGHDWRYLKRHEVLAGVLRDYAMLPTYGFKGVLGVRQWDQPAGAVTGRSDVTTGAFAVGDPTPTWRGQYRQLGVQRWDQTGSCVTTQGSPGQGPVSVGHPLTVEGDASEIADLRAGEWGGKYRVTKRCESSGAVLAASDTGSGAFAIEDLCPGGERYNNAFRVVRVREPSQAVSTGNGPSSGGQAIGDLMDPWMVRRGRDWATGGQFGVVPWESSSGTVTARPSCDKGRFATGDVRIPEARTVDSWLIISPWNTWNRPFTDLELAALQSLVRPEDVEVFTAVMDGAFSTMARKHIGNAVPKAAAQEIAGVFLKCLLAAEAGETFTLDSQPAWARERQLAVMCSLETGDAS